MINKSLRFLKNPNKYITVRRELFLKYRSQLFTKLFPFSFLDDKYYLEFIFYNSMHRKLDFKNPQSLNEKLNWMKLYDRHPIYQQLSNKFLCREYVRYKIGDKFLKPLIAVYDDPDKIEWSILPEKFVLKVTHGCGWNIICSDKRKIDINNAISKLYDWLGQDYYELTREWQYKNITPKIFIEPLFEGNSELGLIEYQFYCFDGINQFIQVDIDCNRNHSRLFLSPDWEELPFTIVRYPTHKPIIPRPEMLDNIQSIVKVLTEDLPFCRVDLHIFNDDVYISEMTIMPGGGFMRFNPPEYDFHFGELLNLRKVY